MIRIVVMSGGRELIAFRQVRHTRTMQMAFKRCRAVRDRYNRSHPGARAKIVQTII